MNPNTAPSSFEFALREKIGLKRIFTGNALTLEEKRVNILADTSGIDAGGRVCR